MMGEKRLFLVAKLDFTMSLFEKLCFVLRLVSEQEGPDSKRSFSNRGHSKMKFWNEERIATARARSALFS